MLKIISLFDLCNVLIFVAIDPYMGVICAKKLYNLIYVSEGKLLFIAVGFSVTNMSLPVCISQSSIDCFYILLLLKRQSHFLDFISIK